MTVTSRALVDLVLLGPSADRRQLQDTPILGDVWIAYANAPASMQDVLITPERGSPAGPVAHRIAKSVAQRGLHGAGDEAAHVAYLQGIIAARLYFEEVLGIIVPMMKWYGADIRDAVNLQSADELGEAVKILAEWARETDAARKATQEQRFSMVPALHRFLALAGIILWAGRRGKRKKKNTGVADALSELKKTDDVLRDFRAFHERAFGGFRTAVPPEGNAELELRVYQVSLNRRATLALHKSVPAVKADAAHTLFNVQCGDIAWAVLDSGIDGTHPALYDERGKSRVVAAYDFSQIRSIVSLENLDTKSEAFQQRLVELRRDLKTPLSERKATTMLKSLADDADNDRPLNWEIVQSFIEIDPKTPPPMNHGTHVAGIIGANSKGSLSPQGNDPDAPPRTPDGVCPDIRLVDFRVLGKSLQDTEFAIIAALQFLRYLNDRHSYISIHGANLSLSIPHDVRNFACGRTPICIECERLVESGVLVVAAAGNMGYQHFETTSGIYEGYTALSITDPGNADGVLTVGATHRYRPHTYGVSFFSSRGPTGDGRLKPDLVAPGERIASCLPDNGWGELDGTSMAAPHVSGAAAMLMARYAELVGEPRRIKRILCDSATDLGRERSFQGHGMLDVLRALQSM